MVNLFPLCCVATSIENISVSDTIYEFKNLFFLCNLLILAVERSLI